MKTSINWEKIRIEYETGEYPNTAIADRYGISEAAIRKKAKAEEWEKPEGKRSSAKTDIKAHLNGDIAKAKFDHLKEKLSTQISPIDEPLLVTLCNQYQRYIELEKRVVNEGEVIISPKTGAPYLNPTFNALQSTVKTLSTLSKEFGLTIASRKRSGLLLDNEDDEEPSIFDFANFVSKERDIISFEG